MSKLDRQYKKYKKGLKCLKKKYFKPKKERAHNSKWRKVWAPILKYNPDWDWSYIVEVLKYKLELTKLYIKTYGHMVAETQDQIVEEITEVIDKFDNWDENSYYDSAAEFSKIHTRNYVTFSKIINGKIVDSEKFYYNEFGQKSDADTYKFVDDKMLEEYAAQANVNLKDKKLMIGYGTDWDSEENYNIWVVMMNDAQAKECSDFEAIFTLLGKNIRNWWD